MKKVILYILLLNLFACESPPVRRSEIIEEHPEWNAQMIKIITEGVLIVGMTPDQVRASWGRPCWSCTGTAMDKGWDKWRTWEYQTQIVFFDKNEKVIRWSKK